MKTRELAKIPGEGMTDSHSVHLFLRNIEDRDYDNTVSVLRAKDFLTLTECINAIRKRERDLIAKRKQNRLLVNRAKRVRNRYDSDDEDDEASYKPQRKVRRLQGKLKTSKRGFICHPDFRNLPDADKSFIQKYNNAVANNESTDTIPRPKGVTVARRTKVRRIEGTIQEPTVLESSLKRRGEESSTTRQKAAKMHPKKGITFNLEPDIDDI